MIKADATSRKRLFEDWIWLFPATYLIHAMEEYWGGEGFYRWVARIIGRGMTPEQFIWINSFGWMLMVVTIVALRKTPSVRWLTITWATVVFINGMAHLVGSIWTETYSPGVVSGTLLWIPLGAATFYRSWKRVTLRSFIAGLVVGAVIHAVLVMMLSSFR
jgi:hypothetical protein